MKIAANIAGALLGLIFIALSLLVLLHLAPQPKMDPASPPAQFFAVFAGTGWLVAVKLCELIGGILTVIPKTRGVGLLFLGPVIFNILCFHILVEKAGLVGPPLAVAVLGAFLLFADRRKFAALIS